MLRNRSASEFPCGKRARVRSAPRPPPRAPRPWQKAQLMRNSDSPALAAAGFAANGFAACPASKGTNASRTDMTPITKTAEKHRGKPRVSKSGDFLDIFMLKGAPRVEAARMLAQH